MCASLRWRPGPAACPAKKRGTAAGSAPLSWGRGGPIHVGRTGPLYSVFHLMAMCSAESGREHLSRSMPSIGRRRPPFTLSGMGASGTSARAAGPPVFPAPQCQDDAARDAQHGQDQDHDIRRRHGTHPPLSFTRPVYGGDCVLARDKNDAYDRRKMLETSVSTLTKK